VTVVLSAAARLKIRFVPAIVFAMLILALAFPRENSAILAMLIPAHLLAMLIITSVRNILAVIRILALVTVRR
jgi:hypothetical protein